MATTFTTQLLRLASDPLGWNGRLLIPAEAAAAVPRREDGSLRVVCTVHGIPSWHGALTSDGQGGHYVIFSKERIKSLQTAGLDPDRLAVSLVPDESDYGAPMPDELAALFEMDPEANEYFHALTPGKQRNLLYVIARYKTEATRLSKSVALVDYLRHTRGRLDFKELGEWMKTARETGF